MRNVVHVGATVVGTLFTGRSCVWPTAVIYEWAFAKRVGWPLPPLPTTLRNLLSVSRAAPAYDGLSAQQGAYAPRCSLIATDRSLIDTYILDHLFIGLERNDVEINERDPLVLLLAEKDQGVRAGWDVLEAIDPFVIRRCQLRIVLISAGRFTTIAIVRTKWPLAAQLNLCVGYCLPSLTNPAAD